MVCLSTLIYSTEFTVHSDSTIASMKLLLAREDDQLFPSPDSQTNVSPASFILTGLELEDQRSKLLAAILSRKSTTALSKIADWQTKLNSLSHRITQWRKVQLLHMPGIPLVCSTEADLPEEHDGPSPVLNLTSFRVKLLLPSDLDLSTRLQCCPSKIVETEIRLRFAVAEDALRDLRKYLSIRKTLVNYKIKHISGPGQRANTRARAIIDRFKSKIDLSAAKYKASQNALQMLDPNGSKTMELFKVDWSSRFQLLTRQDMVFLNDDPEESEQDESSKVSQVHAKKRKRHDDQVGEGHRTPGWIWRMPKWSSDQVADVSEGDAFHATVRIEWAKTKARAERWQEEVRLLQEEMRRAIVDMEWRAQLWTNRVHARPNVSSDLLKGLMAYAYKQADIQTSFATNYAKMWTPILKRHQLDDSFASTYITRKSTQSTKGKQSASLGMVIDDEDDNDWKSDNEYLD